MQVTYCRIELQVRLQRNQKSSARVDREHPSAAMRRKWCADRILNAASQFVIRRKKGTLLVAPLERKVSAKGNPVSARCISLWGCLKV